MMAPFPQPLETTHCLAHSKALPRLGPRARLVAAACFRFSACGLAWRRQSETPSLPASFGLLATSPNFSLTSGCSSESGSSAGSTHFPAHLRWRNLAPLFPAAAASTIFLAAPSATKPDSSSAGADVSPLCERRPPPAPAIPHTQA